MYFNFYAYILNANHVQLYYKNEINLQFAMNVFALKNVPMIIYNSFDVPRDLKHL